MARNRPATQTQPATGPAELADLLVTRLEQAGVEVVFGVPGGAIEPLYSALARSARRGGVRPVVARHETGAAFMAAGYARQSGRIGVCCATSGPGATNLITGVACAAENEIPLLAITGQPPLPLLGRGALQESACGGVDVVAMMRQCCRQSTFISHPAQLDGQLAGAMLAALRPRPGPVHLSIPVDLLRSPAPAAAVAYDLAQLLAPSAPSVDAVAAGALAERLLAARRPVLLVGEGAAGAIEAIVEIARRLGAALIATPDAKGLMPAGVAEYRGVFGFAGHASAEAALDGDCDLVVAVGCGLGEWTSNGWSRSLLNSRLVHVDLLDSHLARSPMAGLQVRGDPAAVFAGVLERLPERPRRGPRAVAAGVQLDDAGAPASTAVPIKPQRLMRDLGRLCPPATRFFADSGNSVAWAVHYLDCWRATPGDNRLRAAMNYAPMGWAIGAAVGAALADRATPVVCLTGDGSWLMSGQELTVAIAERLPLLFVVLNDAALGMVKHGQRLSGAERVGYQLPPVDFAALAGAMGVPAERIERPDDLAALDFAAIFARSGPTVLDVRIDGDEVPPMRLRMKALGMTT